MSWRHYTNMNKTLVIINGVTGALGSACLARLARDPNKTVIGLSRRALRATTFCKEGKLPDATLICALPDWHALTSLISAEYYKEIIYIHAVGLYPLELNRMGLPEVTHDDDGDGIDDRVMELSFHNLLAHVESLEDLGLPLQCVTIESITDAYKPIAYYSHGEVTALVIKDFQERAILNTQNTYGVLSISSVLCPKELMERPYVFTSTDAEPLFWLSPDEVAVGVMEMANMGPGFVQQDLFHKSDYWREDYYEDAQFTARKLAEIGIKERNDGSKN